LRFKLPEQAQRAEQYCIVQLDFSGLGKCPKPEDFGKETRVVDGLSRREIGGLDFPNGIGIPPLPAPAPVIKNCKVRS
jgi:hypothetical protein